jgi:hypothetical protein
MLANFFHVIASEAKQSSAVHTTLDCFALLAMTVPSMFDEAARQSSHFIAQPIQSADPAALLSSIPTSRETNSVSLRSCVLPSIITPNKPKGREA